MKRLGVLSLILLLALTACGAGNTRQRDSAANSATTGEAFPEIDTDSLETSTSVSETVGEKRIDTAEVTAETTQFDSTLQAIAHAVDGAGGYFEQQHTVNVGTYRCASYTIRLPSEGYSEFLGQIGQICHVLETRQNQETVSDAYYDIEARLTTQQIKLERLQALLAQAVNMEDILTVEAAISETELEIEYLTGSLRSYDSRIQYATVTLSLSEVSVLSNVEDPTDTFGVRLGAAFLGSFQDLAGFLEALMLFLARYWMLAAVLIGGVVGAAVLLRRKRARKIGSQDSSQT